MELSDEDWFYESISRYKNLNMFELEQPVRQVEPVGTSSICVACSNSKRHQLLELSLPSKLLSQAADSSETVITSDTDLKIKCGTFTETESLQIKPLDARKVVVSHVDRKGVALYSLSSDSDEVKKEMFNLHYTFESPMFATSGSLIWLTKKRGDQMVLYDMNTEKAISSIKVDETQTTFGCDERIVPMFLGPDIVGFGHQLTGGIDIADNRMPTPMPTPWSFEWCNRNDQCVNFWSFTSLHECSEKFTNSRQNICYAKVSNTGTLMMYDTRNPRVPAYIDRSLGLKTAEGPLQVRFRPGDSEWISASGFNGNVYVYRCHRGEDPKVMFVHDGHGHCDGRSSQTVVTSHMWSNIDNLVISAADNGTVQMWQFENKESD